MFGAALHGGDNALRCKCCTHPLLQLLHCQFTVHALGVQQPCHIFISIWLQKPKRQVFELPFDFPDTQAVGQRRKHLQRLTRQAGGYRQFGRRKMAQRLQARCQAQHDDAQIFGESQQHLAHVLGLRGGGLRHGVGTGRASVTCLGNARHALHFNELVGLDRQRRQVLAKGLGDYVSGLVQMLTGVDQIARCLHRNRAANVFQNSAHCIGMRQRVFTSVKLLMRNQRMGEGPRKFDLTFDVALDRAFDSSLLGRHALDH